MARDADRILTTHVGSLVRPPQLVEYIEAIDRGLAVDQAAFDELRRPHEAADMGRENPIRVAGHGVPPFSVFVPSCWPALAQGRRGRYTYKI